MPKDVTSVRAMLELQGDTVLVTVDNQEYVLTIVHVIDGDKHHLELVNRQSKEKERYELTQAIFDSMVQIKNPVPDKKTPNVLPPKWRLTL